MSSSSGMAFVTRKTSATWMADSSPSWGCRSAAMATSSWVSSVGDLLAQPAGRVLLRLDEQEVADGGQDQERRKDDDGDRDLLLHSAGTPSGTIVATIEKLKSLGLPLAPPSVVESAPRELDCSVTLENSGTTSRRERRSATSAWV